MRSVIFRSIIYLLGVFFALFSLFFLSLSAQGQTTDAVSLRQAELQRQLDDVLAQIAVQEAILSEKQKEASSLARDVAILNARIAEAKLKIKAHAIQIQQLGKDINTKEKKIDSLQAKIERGRVSLADLIRKTNQIDSYSFVDVMLSNKDLSEFFADLDSFAVLKRSLQDAFHEIREIEKQTEAEKVNLTIKKNKEIDVKASAEADKRVVEKTQTEKKDLLTITKNQEKLYQLAVEEKKRRAAQIRTALFALRDSAAIPFGTALNFANLASAKTSVRPAFLLAILTQESNLGENVGTCNRPGDPPEKGWRAVMKPSRDHEPFLRITKLLGLDPDNMPVSCPWGSGYGGAMGPSQFIPSTWELYDDQIQAALAQSSYPNPWDPKTAFMATAIYLGELGANAQSYTAERTAALKYYAGSGWSKSSNAFYGNEVMIKAQSIQENMIDPLQNF